MLEKSTVKTFVSVVTWVALLSCICSTAVSAPPDGDSPSEETEDALAPSKKERIRTDRFSLNLGVGNLGGDVTLSLFTLGYEGFYWTVFTLGVTADAGRNQLFGHGGFTRVGVPIRLGPEQRHEVRIGFGVDFALGVFPNDCSACSDDMVSPCDCTSSDMAFTFLAIPEISYQYYTSPRFALRAGFSGNFPARSLTRHLPRYFLGYVGFSV